MTVEKPVKPNSNLFKIILQTLIGIVILSTAATNLLVVYVIFMPDTFPKPIYLVYQLPQNEQSPVGETPATGTIESGTTETDPATHPATDPAIEPVVEPTSENTGFLSFLPFKIPFLSSDAQPPAEEAEVATEPSAPIEMTPGQGIMLDTGTKIVNLAESGGKKFIRVTATLEFAFDKTALEKLDEEEKTVFMNELNTDLNNKLPVIDDVIITLLSTKDYQSVYTAEGKELLRQQIIEAVNQRLPENHVIYVYFKEFVMQ